MKPVMAAILVGPSSRRPKEVMPRASSLYCAKVALASVELPNNKYFMILLKTTIIVINGIFCTFVNCPVFVQAAAN
jgi:hypothetical protein